MHHHPMHAIRRYGRRTHRSTWEHGASDETTSVYEMQSLDNEKGTIVGESKFDVPRCHLCSPLLPCVLVHGDKEEVRWISRKVISSSPKIQEHVHWLRDKVHFLYHSRWRQLLPVLTMYDIQSLFYRTPHVRASTQPLGTSTNGSTMLFVRIMEGWTFSTR